MHVRAIQNVVMLSKAEREKKRVLAKAVVLFFSLALLNILLSYESFKGTCSITEFELGVLSSKHVLLFFF